MLYRIPPCLESGLYQYYNCKAKMYFRFTILHGPRIHWNTACTAFTDYFYNTIPLTKSLAVEVKLPALKMTVPESSVARFFKVSVWMWPGLSPISLKGLFSSMVPSSHHCPFPGALPDSWQEKVAHSPTKTSVVLRPHTMKTSFTVEQKIHTGDKTHFLHYITLDKPHSIQDRQRGKQSIPKCWSVQKRNMHFYLQE